MKISILVSRLATASLAAALASCSLSTPAPGPGIHQSIDDTSQSPTLGSGAPAHATASGLLFVANVRNNAVDIYDKKPPFSLRGKITNGIVGPNGMIVDPHGDLIVANVDNQTVAVYAPGSKTPNKVYTQGFGRRLTNPLNVALGKDGTLYLVNYTQIGQASEILEYAPGQMKPSFRISLTGGAEGMALDADNNLYVSYNAPSGGRILKFAPHSKNGKDLGISLGFAGGLLLDDKQNLVVCDQTAPAVYVFPPGATKPSKTIKSAFVNPYHIAFGEHFKSLYLADSAGQVVFVYAYPSGTIAGTIQRKFAAFGVAVDPPAPI